jgi:hypothetical protein
MKQSQKGSGMMKNSTSTVKSEGGGGGLFSWVKHSQIKYGQAE